MGVLVESPLDGFIVIESDGCGPRELIIGRAFVIIVVSVADGVQRPDAQELSGISVHKGLGTYILSTSWGVLTEKQALGKRIGGELLVSVF